MLPKNNRNIFPDVSNSQSSSNVNQTFRPSLSSYNSNLIVTQQQQPSRMINNTNNNTFQSIPQNNNNNNNNNTMNHMENAAKRFAAAIHQPQNGPLHLLGRASSSPVQVNTSTTNPQIVLDRQQLIRLPQQSSNQTETAQMNNIYQALYLIQQNLIQQNDKNKVQNTHQNDIHRTILNNNINSSGNNSQPVTSITSVPLSSSTHNNNTTVLTMSNADLQLLEAISRLNSQQQQQQPQKTANHSKVSLIQSDCSVAQQLLNALHKQNPRTTSSTTSSMNSPGFMLIGSSGSKGSQGPGNKDPVNVPATSVHSNGSEITNSLLVKMPLTSKADIPVWTKLLDKLSNNPENLGEVNRTYKIRDVEENHRSINTKILSQPRLQPDTAKYHSKESIPRHNDLISSNSLKTTSMSTKPSSNIDTHQILRDSKIISYMMPSSNNVSINNEDMVNQHFRESLRDKLDIKKTHLQGTQFNYKPFVSSSISPDKSTLNNSSINIPSIRKKAYCSFIDLEKPEYGGKNNGDGTQCVVTPNQQLSGHNVSNSGNNNQLSIKETADAMVENLIKKSLDSKYSIGKHTPGSFINPLVASRVQVTNELPRTSDCGISRSCQPLTNTHGTNMLMNPRDHFTDIGTSGFQDYSNKGIKFTNIRPNPSKSDLPLKKRIMLDFNENCDEDMSDHNQQTMTTTTTTSISVDTKVEKTVATEYSDGKQFKIRRKRVHSDSLPNDRKTDSPSQDTNVSTIKNTVDVNQVPAKINVGRRNVD